MYNISTPLKINGSFEGVGRLHIQFATCFTLASSLAYSSTLKLEAMCSTETSVDFQRTPQCYMIEDRTLHNHFCETVLFFISNYMPRVSTVNGHHQVTHRSVKIIYTASTKFDKT
jgi:hypothetical protein